MREFSALDSKCAGTVTVRDSGFVRHMTLNNVLSLIKIDSEIYNHIEPLLYFLLQLHPPHRLQATTAHPTNSKSKSHTSKDFNTKFENMPKPSSPEARRLEEAEQECYNARTRLNKARQEHKKAVSWWERLSKEVRDYQSFLRQARALDPEDDHEWLVEGEARAHMEREMAWERVSSLADKLRVLQDEMMKADEKVDRARREYLTAQWVYDDESAEEKAHRSRGKGKEKAKSESAHKESHGNAGADADATAGAERPKEDARAHDKGKGKARAEHPYGRENGQGRSYEYTGYPWSHGPRWRRPGYQNSWDYSWTDAKPNTKKPGQSSSSSSKKPQFKASNPSPQPMPMPTPADVIASFHTKAQHAFADCGAMTSFPEPPAFPCLKLACVESKKTRALQACPCNIKKAFQAPGVDLKKSRLQWHPDRFGRCPEAVRESFKLKAHEVFVVVKDLYEAQN
jgi:hypothetical protein